MFHKTILIVLGLISSANATGTATALRSQDLHTTASPDPSLTLPSSAAVVGSLTVGTTVTVVGQDSLGYSMSLSSGISTPNGVVSAKSFIGDGSGITGVATNGPAIGQSTASLQTQLYSVGQDTSSLNSRVTSIGQSTGSLQSQSYAVGQSTRSLQDQLYAVGQATGTSTLVLTITSSVTIATSGTSLETSSNVYIRGGMLKFPDGSGMTTAATGGGGGSSVAAPVTATGFSGGDVNFTNTDALSITGSTVCITPISGARGVTAHYQINTENSNGACEIKCSMWLNGRPPSSLTTSQGMIRHTPVGSYNQEATPITWTTQAVSAGVPSCVVLVCWTNCGTARLSGDGDTAQQAKISEEP